MRYEVKIGILAIVAIGLGFWGFKFIQGTNLFDRSNFYHINYENVAGLTVGTPVQISGVTVGSVADIRLDQQTRLVNVTVDIRRGIHIPESTVAYIATISLLGEKAIEMEYDKPCFGDGGCAKSGSYLEGGTKSILASFIGGGDDENANPLDGIKNTVGGALDSIRYILFDEDSNNPIARSTRDLASTMENLKFSTARLQRIMDQNSGELNTAMDNFAALSTTLAGKQESIAGIIDNAQTVSGNLSELELEETLAQVTTSIQRLQGTLTQADEALGGVTDVMNDVKNGKGTLGKLMTDDAIYERLNRASLAADTLLTDLQERPYRYVPFKSRKRVLKFDRKDAELEEEKQ